MDGVCAYHFIPYNLQNTYFLLLAATMIDSLDTMACHTIFIMAYSLIIFQLIMGLDDDLFTQAVAEVSKIDFTKAKTSDLASVFESSIRHIGGLISAYEMSDGKYPVLVQKAKQLADQLAFAWVGVSFLPKTSYFLVDCRKGKRHTFWTH